MKHTLPFTFFFLLPFIFLSPCTIEAQSPAPNFQTLSISLWPEYDQPDVLVIYRAQLSADTDLPVQLTFRLPDYIEDVNAVAIEQENRLVNVDPELIEWNHDENGVLLTFPTSSYHVHLEYYDPVILSKQDHTRHMTYRFSAPYAFETAIFRVQHPFQADDFSLHVEGESEPIHTYRGSNGLTYSEVDVASLAPGDTVELSVTYHRNTDALSVQGLEDASTIQPADTAATPESSDKKVSLNHAIVIFVGAGMVLLLWWWRKTKQRHSSGQQKRSQKESRVNEPDTGSQKSDQNARRQNDKRRITADSKVLSCEQCGAAFHEDGNFCHVCGAERLKRDPPRR